MMVIEDLKEAGLDPQIFREPVKRPPSVENVAR